MRVLILNHHDVLASLSPRACAESMAADRRMSVAGLALAWLLADERVTQIVIGPGRPEHLVPASEAINHPLTAQERAEIGRAVA